MRWWLVAMVTFGALGIAGLFVSCGGGSNTETYCKVSDEGIWCKDGVGNSWGCDWKLTVAECFGT